MNRPITLSFPEFKRLLTIVLFNFLIAPNGLAALNIAQTPLFLVPSALPIVMLNMPKDHHLYFKAFDDYSDLDGDGSPETTYKHSFDYYGYFDSYKCYDYVNDRFEPTTISINKYCSGQWSGNFLNWASMTRIDSIRKMLYGGLRSSDSTGETELERSYLPNDAHSFAKFYQGSDLAELTPFTESGGITLCNTTFSNGIFSQDVTDPPLMRVAKGNYSLWSANERWQCLWEEEAKKMGFNSISNGNIPEASGINAAIGNPVKATDGLGEQDYIVRVNVCVNDLKGTENCKSYKNATTGDSTLKPVGLLQTYGDDGTMNFGLMTGSYGKNKSGGVLRKNASRLTDEINVDSDGTFKSVPTDGGIINTLNKLRIYGYRHTGGTPDTNGTYKGNQLGSDNCDWGLNTFNNGQCSNWGNPQSEIFLESLRYLAGNSATSAFVPSPDDASRIEGLTQATVTDPITSDDYCASLNVVQFNAATSSYDADELSGVTDIDASDVNTLTDTVGDGVGITGKQYFVGENGTDNNQLCTAKTVTALSKVRGVCPEEPRLSGSYHISGLAHHAHITDIRGDRTDKQRVTTYGLALSQNKPKVVINVPDSTKKITLFPSCRNNHINGNCAIVDFKIVDPDPNEVIPIGHKKGKLYVNWEDSEQGGDFDQDMWGIISYDVSADKIAITTNVIAKSTNDKMGFGYIISGTSNDGFHAHSGINGFNYTDPSGLPNSNCVDCDVGGNALPVTYNIGISNAENLQEPLYYAAQWGGFVDGNDDNTPDQHTEWDSVNNVTGLPPADGVPDQYFFSINPKQAEISLGKVLAEVTKTVGSSASVTSNSTTVNTNTLIFKAKFDSKNWTGQLLAYGVNANGDINAIEQWNAGEIVTQQGYSGRSIFSYNPMLAPNKGIDFLYANLNPTQQALLTEPQVNYIRGDQSNETPNGLFRARTDTPTTTQTGTTVVKNRLLGDIVNSSPLYIGASHQNYERLPDAEGSDYLNYIGSSAMLTRTPMLAVGANDGMLHVFNANKNSGSPSNGGKELFAYVPNTVMGNLAALTSPTYTVSGHHQYFVDGSPTVGDAYFNADSDTDKEWRTVLVGTLGAGGKGIFALDVTFLDTNNYNNAETSFSANRILWEINDQSAPSGTDLLDDLGNSPRQYGFTNNLGYTLGQASVVRMADGQFAAIFGNGYNSTSGSAVLYIVNIKTGSLIRSIGTETSGDNGLSTPLAVDINNDSIVDAIYAGDLQGNLWKFDVSSNNPNNWAVAYPQNSVPTALFSAKIGTEPGQPITVKPTFGLHPNGGILLFFGTGSYFQTGDNVIGTTPQTQSFYGIWDECINTTGATAHCTAILPISGRSALAAQTIEDEFGQGQFTVRKTSDNPVTYPEKKGWYMDLAPPQSSIAVGERVIGSAVLRKRRIIFITNTPTNISCKTGGSAWLMELNPLTGGRLAKTPFDITGDGLINSDDQINDAGKFVAATGFHIDMGMVSSLTILGNPDISKHIEYKYAGDIKINESVPSTGYRQSWAQLR
ncbi:Neisseria PilC domain protein [Crenothrix polyspora]|uniref:Neisseria PilC domain protein n=1 Tax=Crenothrix polyspora TaxID=360316 RepID=A0A1R4HEW1_9GAMM|nr:PilC/PilY family type IV pilus protein [Crenothrix polyspora]SJM94440.1 Neisseria PilC domain protein [Crenothrix polyspora]